MNTKYHLPVMPAEVISYLKIDPSGTYVDCTFGGGGHSQLILDQLNEKGKLIAFDQDKDALQNKLSDDRFLLIPQNFRHLLRFLRLHNISSIDGLLADLGISSHQIDEPSRGFSTRYEAPLDMRMKNDDKKTAADILKNYSQNDLHKIFEEYGEVTNSKTLAKYIVEARQHQSLSTVSEFKNALYPIVKGNPDKYFAQVFQALRIEVNDELGALKEMLIQATQVLAEGGRMVVITFHSLEDRIVKNFYKNAGAEDEEEDKIFGKKKPSSLEVITKKPIIASIEEIKNNPRSRSAKLRAAEKKFQQNI
jgi:16S rRNA (cytosine1402-N4)-methyltransferase